MAKQFTGTVVSTKMQKTIVVEVKREIAHPIYKKKVRRLRRFKVHNENSEIRVGDTVVIKEVRPISKEKRFRVVEITK